MSVAGDFPESALPRPGYVMLYVNAGVYAE
jgi:hypothetical protein